MHAFEITLAMEPEEAEREVRDALSQEGFGVLTEIDVAATLKAKIGVERAPLKILGACNPDLAHLALTIDPSAALVLPCNVVIEGSGHGRTRVVVADPAEIIRSPALEGIAAEAGSRFARVMARLQERAAA